MQEATQSHSVNNAKTPTSNGINKLFSGAPKSATKQPESDKTEEIKTSLLSLVFFEDVTTHFYDIKKYIIDLNAMLLSIR